MATSGTMKINVVGDASKFNRTISRTQRQLKGLGGLVSKTSSRVAVGLGGAGAAAVAAAGKLARFGDEVAESAQKAGLGTEQYQEMKFAFDELGVSAPDKAMQKFNRRIGEAADGSGAAAGTIEDLGVSLEKADGSMRDTGAVMDDAIGKLAGIEDESRRAAAAGDLFGKKAGPELVANLGEGGDSVEDLRQKAHDMGLVMDEDAVEASQKFSGAMDDVKNRALGLLRQGLTPVLMFITDNVIPFIENHVVPALSTFSEWIGPRLSAAAEIAQQFFDTRLVPAFEALSAWWEANGPTIISTARSIGETIVEFAQTSHRNVTAFAGAVSDAVSTVIGWFESSGSQASETSSRMQSVFSQLLSTTQTVWNAISTVIGATIEAVSAIVSTTVAVIQAVWERWGDDIKQFAVQVWNAILNIIDGILQTISGVFDVFAGLFTGDWERVWEGVKDIFAGLLNIIQGLWETALGAVELALQVFRDTLREVWSALWAWAKDFVSDRVDDVVGFVTELPGRARSGLSSAWSAYQEFWQDKFQAVADWASDRFDDVVGFIADLPGKAKDALSNAWADFAAFWNEQFISIKDWVGNRVDDVVEFFRDLPGRIRRVLSNLGSTIRNAFSFDLSIGGEAGGPGSMPGEGSTIDRLSSFMQSTGIPHRVTSTLRPGDDGFHGLGRAVDFAGPFPGDMPRLRAIQKAFAPMAAAGKLKELIGPIESLNFKNGMQGPGIYPANVVEGHKDHVHTAMHSGGPLPNCTTLTGDEGVAA